MIEFESVRKTFRDGTTAVTDLNLTVPSHNFTVIVGPSGCGKTTTLRMVNRMLEPTKGRITWDGTPMRSIRKTKLRRQMGYVIQSGGLFPHRTVLDNITLAWLTNTGVSSARLYVEYKGAFFNDYNISVPAAVSVFPEEVYQAPRSWNERAYHNLIHCNELPAGGHFAAVWGARSRAWVADQR